MEKALLDAIAALSIQDFLSIKLPQVIKRDVAVGVSADGDSRKANNGTICNVTMVFGQDWTISDLIDRLMASNSPKVAVQAVLRKKQPCPKKYEWKVNKSGVRATMTPEDIIAQMSPEDKLALIAKLQAQMDAGK